MYCPATLRPHHYVEIMEFALEFILIFCLDIAFPTKAGTQHFRKSPYHCHSPTHKSILENSQGVFSYGFIKPVFPQRSIYPPDFLVLREPQALKLRLPRFEMLVPLVSCVILGKLLNFLKLQLVNWEVEIVLRPNAFGVVGESLTC